MLVIAPDDHVRFRQQDLAAIQAYLDANGYTILSTSREAGVAIRFPLLERSLTNVVEGLPAAKFRDRSEVKWDIDH